MSGNEIITLQFGHYSNFIGSHWWNIQEASFTYNADATPEISYDVLFREGQNLKNEVTYTPRLLLTDLKGSLGAFPEISELYEDLTLPDLNDDTLLWPAEKVKVECALKCEKNEFQIDLERQEKRIDEISPRVENQVNKYDLDEKVNVWSDYLGTRFHPRTVNILNKYQHGNTEHLFETFAQGVEIWRTEAFFEGWTDRCRAYAEECNNLQGFQVIFDCVDGFSGLTCSALEHLQDEFSTKSVFSFPSMDAKCGNTTNIQDYIRTVNSVLCFSELPDLSSAFTPLSLGSEGWNEPGPPRSLYNISYKNEIPYHTSAILAGFLDSVSISYRRRKNPLRLSALLSMLNPCGRKLLCGTFRLPFPLYPELSVLESFEKLENPFWTTLTPKADVTVDSVALQDVTLRGLSKCRLLPTSDKRVQTNPTYKCKSAEEMMLMYLEYCATDTLRATSVINTVDMPLKLPPSFPNIFNENITRIGYVSPISFPSIFAVVESPVFAGLHNCSSASSLLTHLHSKASKINLRHIHQFNAGGLEQLEYSEALEKLLTLNDNYL